MIKFIIIFAMIGWLVFQPRSIRDVNFSLGVQQLSKVVENSKLKPLLVRDVQFDLWPKPYNAELFLYKLWRPKGFFNLKSS